jgi:hypothetical protein
MAHILVTFNSVIFFFCDNNSVVVNTLHLIIFFWQIQFKIIKYNNILKKKLWRFSQLQSLNQRLKFQNSKQSLSQTQLFLSRRRIYHSLHYNGCQEFMGHPRILQENGSSSQSPVNTFVHNFHFQPKFVFSCWIVYPFGWINMGLRWILSCRNKRVCVDLSCWMVQLQNVSKSHACLKEKVHLRGLFHRLRALIALNCTVVFVSGLSLCISLFCFWFLYVKIAFHFMSVCVCVWNFRWMRTRKLCICLHLFAMWDTFVFNLDFAPKHWTWTFILTPKNWY